MKFQIATRELKRALDIVNHATASVTTTPILENILIKAKHNSIVFSANNLEMAIEYSVEENLTVANEWDFSVPSKLFTSYIGMVADDRINIELLKDDSLQVSSDSGSIKIKWIEASEFPIIPPIKQDVQFHITGNILKKSIEKTLFSSAEWNIRPTLAWIFLNIENATITFASTDSLRLSEFKLAWEKDTWISFSQIIPSKTCSEISRIFEDKQDIEIVSWDNQIAFFHGNMKVYSRLLNWKFPDYSNFFPTVHNSKAVVNRTELIQALRKVNLISRENNFSIRVSLSKESGLLLETSETQVGEGSIPLVSSVDGDDNIIGINSTFLLEALWVIETSHVSISFEWPLSPIMILPQSEDWKKSRWTYRHIIMPLKI